jgi:hypothetical protein
LYDKSTCDGVDLNGKDPNTVTVLGCCKWDNTNNNCWTLMSDNSDKDKCSNLLTPGIACPLGEGKCSP